MSIDIKLQKIGTIYDIDFDDTGEFVLEEGFDTYINLALLTDERADETQVLNPYIRRGWIGKFINNADNPDIQYGSKLWLVGGRKTQKSKNNAIDFATKALKQLITEKEVKDIKITGDITDNGISLTVDFIRNNDKPNSLNYNLWENTML